ncbi:MAG: o-succinylbenzoate--CoA ligase [Chloroflexota bacterium]
MTSATFPNWLHQRAALTPDRLALVFGTERWTFRDLSQRVDQTARRLAGFGIQQGDRVALLMRNGLDFATLTHAVSRLGAVLIPLNIRLTAAEIVWQLGNVGAKCLIYDSANTQIALAAAHDLPELRLTMASPDPSGFFQLPEAEIRLQDGIDLEAVHSIIYTSGTTGKPKGALLTYGNHWWSATGSALNLGLHTDDCWLACLPLFHVGGLAILLRGIIYGNCVIIHDGFDPAAVNRAIDEDHVTTISVVSTMLQRMLDEHGERPYPPSLKYVLLGGGPAPRPLLEVCAECGVPVVQTYGMTETASQFVTLPPEDTLRKLGSAGKPLFPNVLRIERESDNAIAVAGEVGEIVIHGPSVIRSYIDQAALHDGWLHTGDLGYRDEEGYLYVVSRRSDLIISGGENVYPAEVEAVLLSHPAVEEAGVIGVPDERWGQVPAAAIRVREGTTPTPDELRDYCLQRLARYKVPSEFRFVAALPRNAAGKLLRHVLVDQWQQRNS